MAKTAPLSDSIVFAVARAVDDAQTDTRYPSHSDIDFMVGQCALTAADPKSAGQIVGKAKRVRAILSWAIEHAQADGERLTALIIANVRSAGGFRESSPNYVGREAIEGVRQAFVDEGYELGWDGSLQPRVLESLSDAALSRALASYVRRARRGAEDAALLTGTGKDLLEATAAHILTQRFGTYSHTANFPTLLGQAFVAAGLATSMDKPSPDEPAQKRLERALFEAGCAVNALRNKEGTGHGRPWLPTVTNSEATAAVELMGIIADRLLATLSKPHKA
jgi:hypothetical protein